MKRIVFDNLNDRQGKNKGEEFKDMLKDSGVTLHNDDNYGDNFPVVGKEGMPGGGLKHQFKPSSYKFQFQHFDWFLKHK